MFVGFEAKLWGVSSVLGSNPWILDWRALNQNLRKDDLSDWLLAGDSCDNHPAATHLVLITLAVIIFSLSARLTGVCPIRP